jgi:hypothetical protein
MLYAIVWFVVVSLLSLWSLAAWALQAVGAWTVSNAGALGGATAGAGSLRLPEWLAPWVPPEVMQSFAALLAGLEPVVQTLLQAAPALASGLTAATWVVWAIGSVLLVALGAAAHALIWIWRRRERHAWARPGQMLSAG